MGCCQSQPKAIHPAPGSPESKRKKDAEEEPPAQPPAQPAAQPVAKESSSAKVDPICAKRGPYPVELKEGYVRLYCTCGASKAQPFCDGSHTSMNAEKGSSFALKMYTAQKTGTVYFCGCRKSANGVTCDGSHTKLPEENAACADCPAKGVENCDIEDLGKKPANCAKKQPYVVETDADKTYYYCTCGGTGSQPFCDGTHKAVNEKDGTSFAPQPYAAKGGAVAFCGCRRSHAPITCDGTHTTLQPKVASRQPIMAEVEGGETYYYCTCGYSRNQPFCDGSHRAVNAERGTDFKPEPYTATSSGPVAFCGCRRSGDGIMCDGSHMNLPSEAGGRELVAYDFVEYTVVGSKAYNHDSQLLTLRSEKGGEPMGTSYHFSVRIGGKSRPYTPVSYDAAKGEVELVVKRVEGGAVSPLLTALKEGDKLEMKGPSPGEYHWKTGVHKTLLLLAGGSGLTPVLQVLQQVCADLQGDASPSTGVHLVFSNKTEADILLREEIARVQEAHPHVVKSVSLCVTRAPGDVPAPLVKGRLTKDLLSQLVPEADIPAAHVLVCGTPEFNKASLAICTALGYASSQVTIC